jgi:predicted nucleic acid-binding protein
VSDVFLDTVGLLALLDVDDQWHAVAESAYQAIKAAGRDFVTTSFVLLEAGNSASRTQFRPLVSAIRRDLMERDQLHLPTTEDWERGWVMYEQNFANRAGIVDCVSFAVMRRLGLTEAFTNDQHFAAAGFTPLF